MPGPHNNEKEDTTALNILGTTAEAADGRFPAATANAAATLELALGLAFGLNLRLDHERTDMDPSYKCHLGKRGMDYPFHQQQRLSYCFPLFPQLDENG